MTAIGVDEADAGALLALRAAGVSVVIDATAGRLPSILHWGAALPAMDAEQAAALVAAAVPVIASNNADVPPRVAVLRSTTPAGRAGRGWSVPATVDSGRPPSG